MNPLQVKITKNNKSQGKVQFQQNRINQQKPQLQKQTSIGFYNQQQQNIQNPLQNDNFHHNEVHTVHSFKNNDKPVLPQNATIFEKYKYLVNSIKYTESQIKYYKKQLKEMKLSNDPQEIQRLNEQLHNAKMNYDKLKAQNDKLMRSKENLKKERDVVKQQLQEKQKIYDEQKLYSQDISEIQKQLRTIQYENQKLEVLIKNQEMNQKMKIEQQRREEIEEQLKKMVIETAQQNNDPQVQELLRKIKQLIEIKATKSIIQITIICILIQRILIRNL